MRGLRVSKWSLINVYQSWYLQYIIIYRDVYNIYIYIHIYIYIIFTDYTWLYSIFLYNYSSKASSQHPYPLKNSIWGGGVVLKFHFKIPFLQSCFLNDQYSSSFHVIGKQMKIKYLRLAIRLKQHMCRDDIPPKIALPSSYLRLAPPELSASIF